MQRNCIDPILAAQHLKSGHFLLHLSSTCVYGNRSGIIDENSPTLPVEPQAYSKFMLNRCSHIYPDRMTLN